jgi:hypothetical protein
MLTTFLEWTMLTTGLSVLLMVVIVHERSLR